CGFDELDEEEGVSIHAPVKGATTRCAHRNFRIVVSIHAPVKGATTTPEAPPDVITFQSTRP
ncbi:MAG: hypothetical protein ACRC46_14675, partial [Thermoguttaceae bacterium]